MAEVGIRELKQDASAVVRRAEAGEVITVTSRGRQVARIMPLGASRLEELIVAGLARPARHTLGELPLPTSAAPLTDGLHRMREDERY